MTKEEAIEKLCIVMLEVKAGVFSDDICTVADCICGYNTLVGPSPKVSNKVIEFIQEAVNEKIAKLKD